MAISNPNIVAVGPAAKVYFDYYAQTQSALDEVSAIDSEINGLTFVGDTALLDLLSITKIGTAQREEAVNKATALSAEVSDAQSSIIAFFLAETSTDKIYNEDATLAILFDRLGSTISIVTYP